MNLKTLIFIIAVGIFLFYAYKMGILGTIWATPHYACFNSQNPYSFTIHLDPVTDIYSRATINLIGYSSGQRYSCYPCAYGSVRACDTYCNGHYQSDPDEPCGNQCYNSVTMDAGNIELTAGNTKVKTFSYTEIPFEADITSVANSYCKPQIDNYRVCQTGGICTGDYECVIPAELKADSGYGCLDVTGGQETQVTITTTVVSTTLVTTIPGVTTTTGGTTTTIPQNILDSIISSIMSFINKIIRWLK